MKVADKRPMHQELFMDSVRQPWFYNPHVGVIFASIDEGGDGLYKYERCEDGNIMVVPNPRPATSDEMQMRFDKTLRGVFEIVEKDQPLSKSLSATPTLSPSPTPSPKPSAYRHASVQKKTRSVRRRNKDTDEFMSRCTINRVERTDKSRSDMTIITPDGAKFRSIVTAIHHMTTAGI
jgi:hypothetical protein